ncbi:MULTISPECIES: acyl-CoA thioesterase [Niastella]|uniref:Acyl-CoA thioesterase n=1 Tax=Niastella soli TaxID=2821487 RepID=A0ABS3YP54_9BACT|nr:acyl-CoA thioesterase [Niastella soli]MBO9199629.1 acyl-CoA thioesterase [Niastella soli]
MQLKTFYTVRFSDCDPLGHLNNARYIDYFLNAREDHLKQYYNITLSEYHKQGLAWVTHSHNIRYLRPVFYNEIVCIESRLIELGESHVLVELLMFDEKQENLKAIMWTNFTSIDVKTGRRKDHPAFFMDFAATMKVADVNVHAGLSERIKLLRNPVQ